MLLPIEKTSLMSIATEMQSILLKMLALQAGGVYLKVNAATKVFFVIKYPLMCN